LGRRNVAWNASRGGRDAATGISDSRSNPSSGIARPSVELQAGRCDAGFGTRNPVLRVNPDVASLTLNRNPLLIPQQYFNLT
jgi:hypothetical protein